MRATRRHVLSASMLLVAAAAATAAAAGTAGCSILIGVAGDPVVVDEGGLTNGENDAASALDAASADENDAGYPDAGDAAGD